MDTWSLAGVLSAARAPNAYVVRQHSVGTVHGIEHGDAWYSTHTLRDVQAALHSPLIQIMQIISSHCQDPTGGMGIGASRTGSDCAIPVITVRRTGSVPMLDTADLFVMGVVCFALGFLALAVLRAMCAQVDRERRDQHPGHSTQNNTHKSLCLCSGIKPCQSNTGGVCISDTLPR